MAKKVLSAEEMVQAYENYETDLEMEEHWLAKDKLIIKALKIGLMSLPNDNTPAVDMARYYFNAAIVDAEVSEKTHQRKCDKLNKLLEAKV